MRGAEADPKAPGSIALVGFMGAGKSTVGRILSKRLNLPFTDTDEAIEGLFCSSIPEIFRDLGEAEFRDAESRLIQGLSSRERQVIALGGGAFVNAENRAALNNRTRTLWLDVPLELILARLARSSRRPLALDRTERELRALWAERRESYAEARFRIDASDDGPEGLADRILAVLEDHVSSD